MKYSGKIGFALGAVETSPCVWDENVIVERTYKGDVVRNIEKIGSEQELNYPVNINNQLSIEADKFMYENLSKIRYASFYGTNWEVKDITVGRPRVILSIGGEYNGEQA